MSVVKSRDEVALLVKFWNQTEGRDKFCKCLQYGCRGLAWLLMEEKDLAARLSALYKTTADSRKIFRLGKFLNEYLKLQQLFKSTDPQLDQLSKSLNVLNRAAFFAYWVCDNLSILSKIKVIKGDTPKLAKRAFLFWFLALVFGVLVELHKLQKNLDLQIQLQQQQQQQQSAAAKKNSSDGGEGEGERATAATSEALSKLGTERRNIALNIIKNCGDMITAGNGIELPHKILGFGFNDGLIGLGGFVSAFISCFQTYPAA
ncbi:unnamed protein product [Vitrella brassicaformis CCMP3155]|uniref:Peroxisomal biogenesis factor 11 n=1 Tax=Vitrella brassicaformis (strain CCMP3155) TaxID=1169540 RepID=A0A0G4EI84_VITBC|nr:unnamed protein product [Vitrella brassicaformis CCMP3155]|mmetsp:Transcript_20473/g.49817  ORF Transcript_20473/g.49817 Transcript_20473/m.49817 type:complete len:260 (-) Transcript_20473:2060-2839(-)|eukprot:CEL95958.1 unnamed protein product [Vitrella brassicaformis CCMP3155]